MAVTDLPAATAPTVLVQRYRRRVDVCAILANRAVGWVARDILTALEEPLAEYDTDPGHDPLVIAEHRHARVWTLTQVRDTFAGTVRSNSLIAWMTDREQHVADVGYRNLVRFATNSGDDDRTWSVLTAAALLNSDPSIAANGGIGRQRLFDLLLVHGWITRQGSEYTPTALATTGGLLGIVPRRIPQADDPWPQVVFTHAGLTEVHRVLGGLYPDVLPAKEQQ